MKRNRVLLIMLGVACLGYALAMLACAPQKPEPVRTGTIADGEINPANWGKVYPLEYDSWAKTKDPCPPLPCMRISFIQLTPLEVVSYIIRNQIT